VVIKDPWDGSLIAKEWVAPPDEMFSVMRWNVYNLRSSKKAGSAVLDRMLHRNCDA
jgi:hypothetical protein